MNRKMFTLKPEVKPKDVEIKVLKPTNNIWDVIIIGSGPAGLTAAIYSTRSGLSTIIFAGIAWGGQLMTADVVENYPGFPEGILGRELMERIKRQAERFGAKIVYEDILKVDFSASPFKVYTYDNEYLGKTVVIATGGKYRKLGVPSEEKLAGKGVSYCAVCDGHFFKDRRVVVVGGGNTAISEALFLSNIARKVYLIHRRDELRAEKYLQEKVFKNSKIELILSHIVVDILGENQVAGVKLKDLKSQREWILECEGIFIAIGHEPATDLFKGQLKLTDSGHIQVRDHVKTSIPGVYAAGDVADPKYRQAITAAAMGAIAAIEADEFIRKNYKITS